METTMNELSFEAKALIADARGADGPSPENRARVKRALVASMVGATATFGAGASVAATGLPAVAAGKSALTAGTVALWLGMGAGLGTLASAPALVVQLVGGEPQRAAVVEQRAPTRAPESRTTSAEPRAAAPTEAAPSAPSDQHQRAEAPAPVAPSASVSPAPAPSTLASETRLLEAAQRELASGRAASALSLLDEHARRFPGGALSEERIAARVLSLCALGRHEAARQAANSFVAASPRSPLIPRLRGSCAMDGTAGDQIPAR